VNVDKIINSVLILCSKLWKASKRGILSILFDILPNWVVVSDNNYYTSLCVQEQFRPAHNTTNNNGATEILQDRKMQDWKLTDKNYRGWKMTDTVLKDS